jgi:hypothetical protein
LQKVVSRRSFSFEGARHRLLFDSSARRVEVEWESETRSFAASEVEAFEWFWADGASRFLLRARPEGGPAYAMSGLFVGGPETRDQCVAFLAHVARLVGFRAVRLSGLSARGALGVLERRYPAARVEEEEQHPGGVYRQPARRLVRSGPCGTWSPGSLVVAERTERHRAELRSVPRGGPPVSTAGAWFTGTRSFRVERSLDWSRRMFTLRAELLGRRPITPAQGDALELRLRTLSEHPFFIEEPHQTGPLEAFLLSYPFSLFDGVALLKNWPKTRLLLLGMREEVFAERGFWFPNAARAFLPYAVELAQALELPLLYEGDSGR